MWAGTLASAPQLLPKIITVFSAAKPQHLGSVAFQSLEPRDTWHVPSTWGHRGDLIGQMKACDISYSQRNYKKIYQVHHFQPQMQSSFSIDQYSRFYEMFMESQKTSQHISNQTDKLTPAPWHLVDRCIIRTWPLVIEGQRNEKIQNQEGTIMPPTFNFQFYFLRVTGRDTMRVISTIENRCSTSVSVSLNII